MSGLRVGIDLSHVDPAAPGPADHAVLDTVGALVAGGTDDVEPVLFASRALRAAHPDLFAGAESHVAPYPPAVAVARLAAEATWLRAVAGRRRLDLLHHASGPPPLGADVPVVASVHDVAAFDRPGSVGRARAAAHRWAVRRAVGEAVAVAVPSRLVASRLVEVSGVDAARVHVVPWPLPPHGEAARIDMVRARRGIVGRIVLVTGGDDAEASHLVAVRAMRHLAARHGETTMVLLGGRVGEGDRVGAEVRSLGLAERVVRLPDVPEPVRAALFEHAEVVVHLSADDGFAGEVLEAMACGVPVVVADAGSAPELVADAGGVVAPGDDAQLAIEVHRVLDDREWRQRRADEGLARARAHTPARVADQLRAAYRSAMAAL